MNVWTYVILSVQIPAQDKVCPGCGGLEGESWGLWRSSGRGETDRALMSKGTRQRAEEKRITEV